MASRRSRERRLNIDDLFKEGCGPELPPALLRRVAVHEASHIVACIATDGKPHSGRILNRGQTGGDARVEFDEIHLWTLDRLETHLVVLLGGLFTEKVVLGAVSAGAGGTNESDLAICTSILGGAFTSTPLSGGLVYRCTAGDALVECDSEVANKVDARLKFVERRATALIARHKRSVLRIAEAFMTQRYLSGDDAERLFHAVRPSRTRRKRSVHLLEGASA
jgi:cell division protease FtsH